MSEANGVMLQAAVRYAELGYPVFPCAPGAKTPLTEHGFHDATIDPEQIERWWSQHPHANIGIPTAGLVVIDIDGDANSWLADNPDRLLELTCGPMALTPRGGSHRVFRQPTGKNWRCTEGRLAPKVDTRAEGGYIVAPPSVVDGDKGYHWAPGLDLDLPPDQLPEPPPWLAQELDRLANGAARMARVAAVAPEANTIPSGQRNATLAKLAGAMRRVGMGQAEIAAALLQTNKDRCVPPLQQREVERIAASIARYDPDRVAVALAENHWEQMCAADDAEIDDEPGLADPGPIPEELLHVPGFIDEVMAYTLGTAPYPEPAIAFAGALALQALLAGRKVRDSMDNRTNLYVVTLAHSGVGKDHARKVNTRILHEAGLAGCLGTSFASGEGIEDRLFLQPASLFQVDEVDCLLLRISQARDARHEAIVSMLLQMYSSAASVYVMRAKAGRERSQIDQPCLCVFGTAVPKHFYESLSARLMTNGFLARLLILECRPRGEGRDDVHRPLPMSILDAARWWADFRPGGNLGHEHPEPRLVQATPEAIAVFAELRTRIDTTRYEASRAAQDETGMAMWARAYEKARRLSLIYACSADRENPVITPEAAHWAGTLAVHQTQRMLYMARNHASESEFDAKRKRLLDVLEHWRRHHGDEWMPLWKVNRKLPWSSREHEELRETLLAQRLIEYRVTTTRGRPGAVYRLPPATTETPP
jgi:hypothetical protein